ncbi:Elongation of very long chain fatty acids protein 1-like Protein [Tribolium castaneum]|uniref:Elongation of very long chain fatty acids protein n=1 Tax=Tribolium castaneum TaxID=7070 RepID=D6WHH8_TRICA|nr:PREDICTED: elongation of very long chain fatty acids protein 1 [Tribolium castaneum]EFA00084.1 Elongation of very long chain fatty acids protein 1-like Protein [Tribolium castaneum]|eukprot:XP_008191023.1 PREDICTED: elongation of very long chain fatty acids protein 1 [Tribolium castaneum]
MTSVLEHLVSGYSKLVQWSDTRSRYFPFMGSPLPIITVLSVYFWYIFDYGPKVMKNAPAKDITNVMKTYNLLQIFFNFIGITWGVILWNDTKLLCTPITENILVFPHYMYFLLKAVDLIDTVFFVLRKRFDQITFLHVYHHVIMLVGSWVTCNYFPGGQLYFLGFINSFVHAVMYLYYYLSLVDPSYKKSIWWKKHLTQLQIAQHCTVFVTFLIPLLNPECSYPKWILMSYLPACALMIYLFTDFYVNAYVKKKPPKAVQ